MTSLGGLGQFCCWIGRRVDRWQWRARLTLNVLKILKNGNKKLKNTNSKCKVLNSILWCWSMCLSFGLSTILFSHHPEFSDYREALHVLYLIFVDVYLIFADVCIFLQKNHKSANILLVATCACMWLYLWKDESFLCQKRCCKY